MENRLPSASVLHYPARRSFEDIVILINDKRPSFAWTAVTFPAEGYVWLALKDPRILSQTILWFSNGGRHYTPWSGRPVNVMWLEEVTSYFHFGMAESVNKNPLSIKGLAPGLPPNWASVTTNAFSSTVNAVSAA